MIDMNRTCIAIGLFLCALSATCKAAPIIENIRGPHVYITTQTLEPAIGQSYTQPETGVVVTRETDVLLTTATTAGLNGDPQNGNYPGYSKYSNWSDDNSYYFALSTWPDGSLWKNGKFVRMLKSKSKARIFESREPRWTGNSTLTYIDGFNTKNLCEQDVAIGPSSEKVLYSAQYELASTGDGDWSADRRYYAVVEVLRSAAAHVQPIERVGVFDRQTGQLLQGKPVFDLTTQTLNGVNILPDGEFLLAETSYYRISDLRLGIIAPRSPIIRGGHAGYIPDTDGKSLAVWQESADDHIWVYKPSTGERYASIGLDELGWCSIHIASCKNPAFGGCYIVSTYPSSLSANSPFRNQIFIVQLGRTNKYDRPLMGTGVSNAQWESGFLPVQPKILRLASTNNLWLGYFSECSANLNLTGDKITFGGNWNQHDNLENYAMVLPANWHDLLAGAAQPTPTATPTPTQTPTLVNMLVADAAHRMTVANPMHIITLDGPATATLSLIATPTPSPTPTPAAPQIVYPTGTNFAFDYGGTLGSTTQGDYILLCSFAPEANSANSDTGMLLQFDLSGVPTGFKKATLVLTHRPDTEFGGHPTGREGIAVRRISGPAFTPAWIRYPLLKKEQAYNGASWLNRIQTTSTTTRWSTLPSSARVASARAAGDLSTVMDAITTNTPRLNFSTTGTVSEVEITALARNSQGAMLELCLDAMNCTSPDRFGSPANPNSKAFRCRQAVFGNTGVGVADKSRWPYLKLEY